MQNSSDKNATNAAYMPTPICYLLPCFCFHVILSLVAVCSCAIFDDNTALLDVKHI